MTFEERISVSNLRKELVEQSSENDFRLDGLRIIRSHLEECGLDLVYSWHYEDRDRIPQGILKQLHNQLMWVHGSAMRISWNGVECLVDLSINPDWNWMRIPNKPFDRHTDLSRINWIAVYPAEHLTK